MVHNLTTPEEAFFTIDLVNLGYLGIWVPGLPGVLGYLDTWVPGVLPEDSFLPLRALWVFHQGHQAGTLCARIGGVERVIMDYDQGLLNCLFARGDFEPTDYDTYLCKHVRS